MVLEIIVLTFFFATIFNIVLNRFNMPTIIGYILTWTLISCIFWFYHLENNTNLKIVWEFWIVFLMFMIWLEFSVKDFIQMKKNVLFFWSLQFFWISIIFYLISIFVFKISSKESLVIALALTLSSTAIVLKILKENWDINRNYWNRVLWILLFQDLMVIPILLLITILSINSISVYILLSKTFLAVILLFFVMWFFWKYLLEYFLYIVAKTKSNEIFIWSILLIIIASSFISNILWFSYTLGAFIAWMLIAETNYKHQIEADLIAFRDLLLWIFFITVWFQLDLWIIFQYIWTILILFTWFLIIKFLFFYVLLRFFLNRWASLKTSIALFQFWEFWIVIFEIANSNNILDSTLSHIMIVVIIMSMIITPFILKHIYKITDFFIWIRLVNNDDNLIFNKLDKDNCFLPNNLRDHVILIWYSRLWKLLWNMLELHNIDYVILENDIRIYKKAKKEWKPIVYWNAHQLSILNHVKINHAKSIIITIWENEWLLLVAGVISKLNLQWKIIVRAADYVEHEKLSNIKITDIIVESEKTALSMFNRI